MPVQFCLLTPRHRALAVHRAAVRVTVIIAPAVFMFLCLFTARRRALAVRYTAVGVPVIILPAVLMPFCLFAARHFALPVSLFPGMSGNGKQPL